VRRAICNRAAYDIRVYVFVNIWIVFDRICLMDFVVVLLVFIKN